VTTPNELSELKEFEAFLVNMTKWVANASAVYNAAHPPAQFDIKVGMLGLDQEQICGYCWSRAEDGTCNATVYDDLTAKNNMFAAAAARALPGADIYHCFCTRDGLCYEP
jgi:hypothetical protein